MTESPDAPRTVVALTTHPARNPLMWARLWQERNARLEAQALADPFLYESEFPRRRRMRRTIAGLISLFLGPYLYLTTWFLIYRPHAGQHSTAATLLPWVVLLLGTGLPWVTYWALNRSDEERMDRGFEATFPSGD